MFVREAHVPEDAGHNLATKRKHGNESSTKDDDEHQKKRRKRKKLSMKAK